MKPIIVSQADYEAGNYPKGVPVMVGIQLNMESKSDMGVGKTPTKIKVTFQPA